MRFLYYILILSSLSFAQEVKYLSINDEFKIGESYFMFGDKVQLRAEPNTDAAVMSLLNIGDAIQIIGKTNIVQTCNGQDSHWVQVDSNNQIGFILDCFIALDKASFKDYQYFIALEKKENQYYLKTRLKKGAEDYIENKSPLHTYTFSINADGSKGLNNVESIFTLNYLAEACGVDGGGFYLFKNGNSLTKALEFTIVADADLYWLVEEFIFPTDEEGLENKIIYKAEMGETLDYETNWVETRNIQRQYSWDGNSIQPQLNKDELFNYK